MTTVEDDEFWPLSGKPYFHCILHKSHVKPNYNMVLPLKIYSLLPSVLVPVIITRGSKNWKMLYHGDRPNKRLDPSWKKFADDNNLTVGDGCVFELLECSSELIKFRVQILDGKIPTELIERLDGESSNIPIIID